MESDLELKNQISLLAQWWQAFQAKFPTADIVSIDNRNNAFTVKIRYDDIFRYYYNEIKKQLPDSKISLKECEFSLYKLCAVVKYNKLITGWENYGMKPEVIVDSDYEYLHYVPFEQLIEYFKQAWREANKNSPIIFRFLTKHDEGIIWFYVRIIVPRRMGSTTTLISEVGDKR